MSSTTSLKVGFVPEHFSTPLHFAQAYNYFTNHGLTVTLEPFTRGTGTLIEALRSQEIDIAIGLTEGFIAGLGKGEDSFRLVGSYVDTPLCWSISTGKNRDDITGVKDLKKGKIGISRNGSGSHIMSYVLAQQEGWLDEVKDGEEPFDFVVLGAFEDLRKGVNDKSADAFMWEIFTSKKYYDSGEIKKIGQIYTPWPSWHVVARKDLATSPEVKGFLEAVQEGINYFNEHKDEAVQFISTKMPYSEEDAREWLKTVKFSESVLRVKREVVEKTNDLLIKAKAVEGNVSTSGMVVDV
ncbi:periplasmic binding protein-like II [Ascobolus immersus RN42]|uniref:Periplasmic binding protein-like II n=1 Tax=Ascobolus immersus RN42 TaxID=1160509 RepID=A0A3N4IGS7_ASCIM|nr:periplasmic binding protein-like II [Ascobolus immersus RN42]